MSEARAYWAIAPGRGAIRDVPLGEGEAVVRTLWSAISRGTESLVAAGRVPESEHERMRCPFQDGAFPFPVKYGYCNVGIVERGPEALVGRTVFCLYPHQTRYAVPAAALTPLPDGLPPRRATLAANMETALNATWDAGVMPGDRVLVAGAGVVGLLVAWLARQIPGTEVLVIDPDAAKAGPAAALGLELAAPGDAPGMADCIIECSGNPNALAAALDLAGPEAAITVVSWFGSEEARLPLGGAFHSRRLQLRSSQVGQLPPGRRARWSHRRRLEKALELCRDPALDALFTGTIDFDDLPECLPSAGPAALCRLVRYPQGDGPARPSMQRSGTEPTCTA